MYRDEPFVVDTARQILHLNGYENTHPPFGEILVASSIFLLGDHSWVWRLSSLLSGFGCIVLIFLISKTLTRNSFIGFLSAFLFAMDGLNVVFSRIAMLEAPMLFSMLLSVYTLSLGLCHGYKTRYLIVSALFFGLGVATKWIALAALFPLCLLFYKIWGQSNSLLRHQCQRDSITAFSVAIVVYLSTFLIFPFIKGYNWLSIFSIQNHFFHQLSAIPEFRKSPFWTWPLLIDPITFLQSETGTLNSLVGWRIKSIQAIVALGNPAVVWGGCLALLVVFLKFVKQRKWFYGFILVCFISHWILPWIFVTRQKYSFYFYPAMPFLCMALGQVVYDMLSASKITKILALIYLFFTVAMFMYWYPLWTNRPLSESSYKNHLWLKSWHPVSLATFKIKQPALK